MEEERLKYTINRLDHYYESINNKTTVYIGINTFITGGIIVFFVQLKELIIGDFWLQFFLIIAMILGMVSLVILAWTNIPYMSTKIDSLYYFGTIGKKEDAIFYKDSKEQTKKGDIKDLRCQVHLLSKGLIEKFKKLKGVGILLIFQFIILAPVIYLLIKKIL